MARTRWRASHGRFVFRWPRPPHARYSQYPSGTAGAASASDDRGLACLADRFPFGFFAACFFPDDLTFTMAYSWASVAMGVDLTDAG
jgi:hypothetical protein